jgi:hypothetical protein
MAALTRGHAQFRSSAVATPTPTVSINPSSASIQAALPNQHGPCLNRYADVARLPARVCRNLRSRDTAGIAEIDT